MELNGAKEYNQPLAGFNRSVDFITKLILVCSVAVVNIQIMAGSLVKVGTAILTQIRCLPSWFLPEARGSLEGNHVIYFPQVLFWPPAISAQGIS